jgi:hypothetical protein
MSDTPKPIAVMDAQDRAQETAALQHRLDWLRAEGIDPDKTLRVEVFSEDDGLCAVLTSHGHQDGDVIRGSVDLDRAEFIIRRPVSSLPPVAAAAHSLAARTGKGTDGTS